MKRIRRLGVWLRFVLLAGTVLVFLPRAFAGPDEAQVQRQITQLYNNAPIWREVRSGRPATTEIKGVESGVLIQSQGETWRELRNGPVSLYGGIFLIGVPILIFVYYKSKGALKLGAPLTGRMIQRFSDWDRLLHWTTAISFLALALSGLVVLFGKHVLLPVLGYSLFSWLAILSKNLHNFVGRFSSSASSRCL